MRVEDAEVEQGGSAVVPISVAEFSGVTTFQCTLTWDPSDLQFEAATDFGVPGLGESNFGMFADAGKLTVSWNDPSGGSQTLPDGETLFTLQFKALAAGFKQVGIQFGTDPTPAEVTVGLVAVNAALEPGMVRVQRRERPVQLTVFPADQTVILGDPVLIESKAVGTAPIVYQWFKDGAAIPGATEAALHISSVEEAHAGIYRVRVSNQYGTAIAPEIVLRVVPPPLPPPPPDPVRTPGDFDGSHTTDLVFQTATGDLGIWLMDGVKLREAQLLDPRRLSDSRFEVVGSGDFNGDNEPDLLFQDLGGRLAVWLMDGIRLQQALWVDPPGSNDRDWRARALADLDENGGADIFFQHGNGSLAVWLLDGIRMNRNELFAPAHPGDARWRLIAADDFDQDGGVDLFFQHEDGTLAVWYLDQLRMTEAVLMNPPSAGPWRALGTGDWNGDQKPDLLFRYRADGDLAVWLMDGIRLIRAERLDPPNPGQAWKLVAP